MAEEVRRMVRLLEEAVARSGRSRPDLARAVGLPPGTLDDLFAGGTELQVRHLLLLARELQLDPVGFFEAGLAGGAAADRVLAEIERAFADARPARRRAGAAVPAAAPAPDLDLAEAKDLVRRTIREELARLVGSDPADPRWKRRTGGPGESGSASSAS